MKKVLIIILLVAIALPVFSKSDVINEDKKGDGIDDYTFPCGISEINVVFGGWPEIYGLSPETLIHYQNMFKFIEDIFKTKGIPYDADHLNKLVPGIYGVVSKAWRDAWMDLEIKCQTFKDAHGGDAFKQFKEKIRNYQYPFNFTDRFTTTECYARTASCPYENRHDIKSMQWPHDRLETIIRFLLDNNY